MRTLFILLLITATLTAYSSKVYYPSKGTYYHMPTHGYQVNLQQEKRKKGIKSDTIRP